MYSANYPATRHRELLAQARRDGQVAHARALRRSARRVERATRRLERARSAARRLRGAGQMS
ncbi:MAG TPA: hypothetical protein VMH35_04085 [Streptosporangiaceae bacterium]|nr:hypothetical protein [Streptosporangiaceae bacterium]